MLPSGNRLDTPVLYVLCTLFIPLSDADLQTGRDRGPGLVGRGTKNEKLVCASCLPYWTRSVRVHMLIAHKDAYDLFMLWWGSRYRHLCCCGKSMIE